MRTIILYHEERQLETAQAVKMQKHFGCESIVHDWHEGNKVIPNALHLTNRTTVADAISLLSTAGRSLGLYFVTDAMRLIEHEEEVEKKSRKGTKT